MENRTYKIPAQNMPFLQEKFAKLGKRAVKLGLPVPTFTETGTSRLVEKDPATDLIIKTTLLNHIVVDLGCNEVKVEGWTFIATIQHTEEGNILRKVGEVEIPNQYREVSQLCEHCNTIRNRKDTYILRHDSGETKQVGRNCLADFFGHDALMYAERAQYLLDAQGLGEAGESYGAGGGTHEALEEYLSFVAECIKLSGWMSRGRSRQLGLEGQATADVATRHQYPHLGGKDFQPMFNRPSTESVELAEAAINWAAELEGEELSDYLHNIRIIARRMVCESRDMGLAASIVSAYQRHLNKLVYQERLAKRSEIAQHVGNPGDKIRIKVLVEKVIQIDSTWGLSYLHIMSNDAGNVFTWFSSSGVLDTGKEVVLQGTIKSHTERDGVKQNQLTRCSEVSLHQFLVVVGTQFYRFEAASEAEVKKMLREKLGVKKLPTGLQVLEDKAPSSEEVHYATN